ncbi:hydroxyacid dehydrogenase [Rathayibacter sp. CAU 1779]
MRRPTAFLAMSRDRYEDVCSPADHEALRERFSLIGPFETTPTIEEIREGIGDSTVLFTSWGTPSIDRETLERAPELRAIAHAAGSVKHLVPPEVFDRGIGVFSAGIRIADSVAEYCLAAMLTLARRLPALDARMRAGSWGSNGERGRELRGSTIGIVGASSTARSLISLLKPFDARIRVFDPYLAPSRAEALGVELAGLESVMQAEFVSLHVPSTPETEGMVTADLLDGLPQGGVLVNSSRGTVVDQDALLERIADGRIRAALDVFEQEPFGLPHELVDIRSSIFTPHVAGDTYDGHRALLGVVAADAAEWLASGASVRTLVDAQRWAVSA